MAQPETEGGADVAMHRAVGGGAHIFIKVPKYLPKLATYCIWYIFGGHDTWEAELLPRK